jgi:hypothetical protein
MDRRAGEEKMTRKLSGMIWKLGSVACVTALISACSGGGENSPSGPTGSTNETAVAATDPAYPEMDIPPVWDKDDKLFQPKDFREWVFIGAPLTPNGLNDGKANFPEFHNVYVQPAAFKAYRATGKWPEGTMMVKELQLVGGKAEFSDGSRYEPSGRGYFPGAVNGLDVAVKDSKRFKESNNWGYFNFNHSAPPYLASTGAKPIGECAGCHIANADEDMVYVSLYKPILDPLPLPGK